MVRGNTCLPTVHSGQISDSPQDAGGVTVERNWRNRAACRAEDPELFFPVGNGGPAVAQIVAAKAVCAGCPVATECLTFALVVLPEGIAGGLTTTERRELQAHRDRASSPPAAGALRSPLPGGVDRQVVASLIAGERVAGASRLELAQAAAELARAGHGCRWIGTRLGVHDRQVYRWLARYRAGTLMVAQADRRHASAVAS
jgi:WhiB family redox-sensing transcriptional regulator